MASDPKTFLAASVLNDGSIVSYRTLSREAKVHSNAAKKMLYDFYQKQTSKKPGSVHATYLIDGVPKSKNESNVNGQQKDSEDMQMQSSPYMSSSMPQDDNEQDRIHIRSIVLAREEDLIVVKSNFEQIHSIHIYSLEPSSVQNLQTLSECNRSLSVKYAHEDPLVAGKQYGIIQNAGVKRRSGWRLEVTTKPVIKSNELASGKFQDSSRASIKPTQSSDRPLSNGKAGRSTPQPDSKPSSKPATLKREQSDIFKSFSKPTANLKKEDTGSSTGTSPAPSAAQPDKKTDDEDEPMKDASEDEQEEDFIAANNDSSKQGKSHSEREADLRKMMDEEDEGMEDTVIDPSQESAPVDPPVSQTGTSPEPPVVVTEGRRRGRRKVMKKRMIKDEEGYLVTKEEPAWESFSEDEPPPQKEKTPTSTTSSAIGKGKKAIAKPGQGNIMSFFGKR
ncbi:hypothetical protein N7G274_007209 [Stereocaulon virgatum]|uniref:DNA polymerase delta subunit 3 n=1 Tax=Stereocaulon virgatum TaxID=373712 RepID=A0ABR4A1G4_9LECA